jgi:hypothetical protein
MYQRLLPSQKTQTINTSCMKIAFFSFFIHANKHPESVMRCHVQVSCCWQSPSKDFEIRSMVRAYQRCQKLIPIFLSRVCPPRSNLRLISLTLHGRVTKTFSNFRNKNIATIHHSAESLSPLNLRSLIIS